MSIYQKIGIIGPKYFSKAKLFKYGFNYLPMYRRSTARVTDVSEDLLTVKIKLPINYKNRNYVGSIFGGSMFSSADPIPMVQLINILKNEFIVWDKSAEIYFKAPAREALYAEFTYSRSELDEIRKQVSENGETEIIKTTLFTNKGKEKVFCEVKKTIYIASKEHYKKKRQAKVK